LIAVVSREHKKTGSTSGHPLAATSPLQAARIATAPDRFEQCKAAVLDRDFSTLARVVELDNNMMHSVMMTSDPVLLYWLPETLRIMHMVQTWRKMMDWPSATRSMPGRTSTASVPPALRIILSQPCANYRV
jgi:diphosphomevalonate decarboxylase